METVPRIHVQELFAAAKQQYKAESERGVPQGSHPGPASAAERRSDQTRRRRRSADDETAVAGSGGPPEAQRQREQRSLDRRKKGHEGG